MIRLRIKEIPGFLDKYDFDFLFCTFLDSFYRCKTKEEKGQLIMEEPEKGALKHKELALLASTAHKLAADNGVEIPQWVYDDKYFLKSPVYEFNTKNREYRAYLRETSPQEYKMRNIYYGDNVLMRV